jgi:hypothetical protein
VHAPGVRVLSSTIVDAMARLSWCSLAVCLLAPAASLASNGDQERLGGKFDKAACPDYALYASFSQ